MEEVKKNHASQSRMQGTQRTFTSEKKQTFDVKCMCVCTCKCPDTLKHMVACDGCDNSMVPWPPCICQRAPQSNRVIGIVLFKL